MKISSNDRLAEFKNNWIDFNAFSMDEEGLYKLLLEVINGEKKVKTKK